jgi:hypothetical protein
MRPCSELNANRIRQWQDCEIIGPIYVCIYDLGAYAHETRRCQASLDMVYHNGTADPNGSLARHDLLLLSSS